MAVLYVCIREMRRTHILKATLSKTCSTNSVDPFVKSILAFLKTFHEQVNNIFLLLDNIEKIVVFK